MLVVLAMMALCGRSWAQLDSLYFKNHLVDGRAEEFGMLLLQDSFTVEKVTPSYIVMRGRYAMEDSCIVHITKAKNIGKLTQVIVTLPPKTDWSSLNDCYISLKEALIMKYGEPHRSVEDFLEPYPEGEEMQAVKDDKVYYTATWGERGELTLYLSKKCAVMLRYLNVKNNRESREAITRRIAEDL